MPAIVISCGNPKKNQPTSSSPLENNHFKIEVTAEKQIPLSSGSGITGFKYGFLVVGDDTPWMYYMDSTGVITDSLRLSHEDGYVPGVRMPGMLKPDFESITRLNKNIVLVLSSGSSNIARDTAYMVNAVDKIILAKRSLGELYEMMADSAGLEDRHTLNIEGSTVAAGELYLFNRGDFSGMNMIYKFSVADFIAYVGGKTDSLPKFVLHKIDLRGSDDDGMTFSAAYYIEKYKIFVFSVTIESGAVLDDEGMVSDGIIGGTAIGFIKPGDIGKEKKVAVNPITKNGKPLVIKLEGFWPLRQIDGRTVAFYGVSDPDDGTTVLYTFNIQFNDSI